MTDEKFCSESHRPSRSCGDIPKATPETRFGDGICLAEFAIPPCTYNWCRVFIYDGDSDWKKGSLSYSSRYRQPNGDK